MAKDNGEIQIEVENEDMSKATLECAEITNQKREEGYTQVAIGFTYDPQKCKWVYKMVFKKEKGDSNDAAWNAQSYD